MPSDHSSRLLGAGLDWPGAHSPLPRSTLPLCLWVDKPLLARAKPTPKCLPFSPEAIYCFQRNQPSERSPVLHPLLRTYSPWLKNANIRPDTRDILKDDAGTWFSRRQPQLSLSAPVSLSSLLWPCSLSSLNLQRLPAPTRHGLVFQPSSGSLILSYFLFSSLAQYCAKNSPALNSGSVFWQDWRNVSREDGNGWAW